jgi:hypothetical protein
MTTLEELAELLAASTPAPWKVNQYWLDIPWLNRADAALIVAAINALPGLIESAKQLREVKSAAESVVFEMDDDADEYIIRDGIRRLAAALLKSTEPQP